MNPTKTNRLRNLLRVASIFAAALLAFPALAAAAPTDPPAGGAELSQVLIGGFAVALWSALLVYVGLGHRTGRVRLLRRVGGALTKLTHLPAWAILPALVAVAGLLLAGLGFVWDVGYHIDKGRDAGPFANPSHYPIFIGIQLMLGAAVLAALMPTGEEGGASAVRIAPNWPLPAGAILMLAGASTSLIAFPLDDVWHRLFGQDVTLWGPTHLALITGGLMLFVGSVVLLREGHVAAVRAAPDGRAGFPPASGRFHGALAGAILLTGMTLAYQQEFGYGVPQFRLMFHPLLIVMAAGMTLVGARLVLGRGSAMLVVALSFSITLGLTLFEGPLMGGTTLHFPLYAVEGVIVELVALSAIRRSPYAFAAVCGALLGTVGVLGEWGWSHLWMPLAWPDHMIVPAMARAVPVAIGSAAVGVFVALCLSRNPNRPSVGARSWLAPAAGLAITFAILGSLLPTHAPPAASASLELSDAPGSDRSAVNVLATFNPRDVAESADWVQGLSWQSGGKSITAPLRRVSEGVYGTTEPLGVDGSAKSLIRLQRGSTTASVVVRLPADSGIPAPAVLARDGVERPLVHDPDVLQRERKPGVPGWLRAVGASVVFLLILGLISIAGWVLLRVGAADRPQALVRSSARSPLRPWRRASLGAR